jgi:hypothetical protein
MRASRIFVGRAATGAASFTQAAFRWGDDDGNEASYTFLAAQNVDISRSGSLAAIIRFLINTTGDTPASQMKLQVKRSTGPSSEWRDVPLE